MGYKRIAAAGLVLGSALVLMAAQEARKPLVRKDLLVFGSGVTAPPLRDIFRPKATVYAPAPRPVGPAVTPGTIPGRDAPGGFSLDLSYIGSIDKGGRTIALVVRNGQTVSVGEGEEVAPGYRVIRVTLQEIVVEGPNNERKTFRRQGDRP